jgi:DNA mismatch repair protein MutL
MRRVFRMPEDLANQIAAGEVVERPASALKELIENAIDAGATHIKVDLEEGGLRLLRVTDDGSGMSEADAVAAMERHATSKLRSADDLFRISTLGFRGEALPSIASVSRFEMVTKLHGALEGIRLRVEGGGQPVVEPAGCPAGTQMTIRDLFFNTPARLKFLKTRGTEVKHCIEAVQHLALARPEVGFTVVSEGRTVLDWPAVADRAGRIFSYFGRPDSDQIHPTEVAVLGPVSASGFIGEPGLSRRTSAQVITFVNGRYVRDRLLASAVRVAYQHLVDRARYPVSVLYLELPHDAVDVNVHPMKTEVRFHQPDEAFRAIRRAVSNTLAAAPWVRRAPSFGSTQPNAPAPTGPVAQPLDFAPALSSLSASDLAPLTHQPARTYRLDRGSERGLSFAPAVDRSGPPARPAEAADHARGFFSALHYLAAFKATYLLAADGDGLVVVDQHAAHERITFEALRLSWKRDRLPQQPMLIPAILTFSAVQSAVLEAHLGFFEALGFELEPFGGNDFALKAVPAIFLKARHHKLLQDAIEELAETGQSARVEEAFEAVLSRMACHGSVRAGDNLSHDEVRRLFADLDAVDFGANCPHGRPVWFRMTLAELETRFGRR